MPKTKNYKLSESRATQASIAFEASPAAASLADDGRARIDMLALLGPEARFARGDRNLDLNHWLGRGIDAWVWASIACLKSLLLAGSRQTSTVTWYSHMLAEFFRYLTAGRVQPLVASPNDLIPIHVDGYAHWLQKEQSSKGWTPATTRAAFNGVKPVIIEMISRKFVSGSKTNYFRRAQMPVEKGSSRHPSLSDAEQERLAAAIKLDLVSIYHRRIRLNPMDIQALRLLIVGHRQGLNPTPLLELHRSSLSPGILPTTMRMRTKKYRNKKVRSHAGRMSATTQIETVDCDQDVVFDLSEGAVLQMAIKDSESLVASAPTWCRDRIWLYRIHRNGVDTGTVTCLTEATLKIAVKSLIDRHQLVGDDGQILRLNLSRLRKSFFDRSFRASAGDLVKVANLMGDTAAVAAIHYPSMNISRKAEAAAFMNSDYIAMMRSDLASNSSNTARVIDTKPLDVEAVHSSGSLSTETPVSRCKDSLSGEHAPKDGHNHCDRYVMCLFCASFGIVGTAEELWRLYSFQAFAKLELARLDSSLGAARTDDTVLEDLRDRYRLAIPYIDNFTKQQFPARLVAQARARTSKRLHPFWILQIARSRRA